MLQALHRLLAPLMGRRAHARRRPVVEELEPRILYSADANPLLWAGGDPAASAIVAGVEAPGESAQQAVQTVDAQQARRREIVFIDAAVADAQALIDSVLAARPAGTEIELVQIDAGSDGVTQINAVLAHESGLDAVHIVAHGTAGLVQLGTTALDETALAARSDAIAAWGRALNEQADILLYGCDVAGDAAGQRLVDELARLTGADVAASTDLTANAAQGGDWTLEYHAGRVDATSLFEQQAPAWTGVLSITANGSSTSTSTTGATSLTWSHTVASGSDRVLFVEVAIDGLGAPVTGVTYGGVALTQVGRGSGNHAVEIWRLVAPAAGTADVVVSFGGTTAAAAGAVTYNGVDQSSPTGTFVSASGTGTTASVTAASAIGDLVLDVQYWRFIGSTADGAGQTAVWSAGNATLLGGSTQEAGAASVVMSGTSSFSTQWEIGAVSVNASNDVAPVNTVPGAQSTNEDTPRVFSAPNGNAISISDADAGGANNEVTISVTNGTLTLAGTTGLTFAAGDGTADATMTVRGTASAINTALNGLSYSPTANYSGGATLTLSTKDSTLLSLDIDADLVGHYTFDSTGDLGHDTSPAGTNDGTVSSAVAASDATRGDVLSFDGFNDYVQVSGRMGSPANVTLAAWVNLDAGAGELISIGDSVAIRLDEALNGVNGFFYNGLTWNTLSSGSFIAGTGWHHVAYVFNDTGNIHTLYIDGAAQVSAATAQSISYTLGANTFIGRHGSGSSTYLDGDVDDARVYDRALTAAEVAALAADLSLTDTDTVAITVAAANDAPSATNLSAAESYTEDTALNLINIVISDVDSASVTATLTLSNPAAGSLNTATAGAVTSTYVAGTGVWTASGAPADVNILLAGLTFTPASNFNGNFTIATSVSDGVAAPLTGSKAMTGTAVNDVPVITSGGGGATAAVGVAEDATAVVTVAATDGDTGATLSYTIVGGADAARFALDSASGALTFVVAPNFEAPTDAGSDNVYDVTVQVSDGNGGTDTQAIAVTVSNVNETPVITSDGGGATASVSVVETRTTVTTVTRSDVDGPSATYSIVGGADAARFAIDGATGALSFAVAPDYEASTDANLDNVYEVVVRVADGSGGSDTQAISVSVTDVAATLVVTTATDNNDAAIVAGNAQHTAEWLNAHLGADGQVSLREAIIAANNTAGLDTIGFAIGGGGAQVISVTASLPTIIGAVVLDATTQAGYAGTPLITIDGAGAGANANGLVLQSSGSTVRGFEIRNFTQGSSATTGVAILLDGRTGAGDGNTISANRLTGNSNAVGGSVGAIAVVGAADNNVIDGNTLLNNNADGIRFADGLSGGNQITNNLIDGQGDDGARLVGSNITFSGNTVSNSQRLTGGAAGVELDDVSGAVVANNIITAGGTEGGVWILGSSDVTLSGNTVSGGVGAGIAIDAASSGVTLTRNLVFGNAGLGIDLGRDGVSANDAGDADAGANGLQNFPVLTSAAAVAGDTSVAGSISATANTTYRIEFFGSPTADASSHGEGQVYLGFIEVTTDSGGSASFDTVLGGVAVGDGHAVSATATVVLAPGVYGNTSEFSACITANRAPVITSAGGGASAALSVAEGSTAVTTVSATDAELQTPTYAIIGGADAARFAIDSATGVLSFVLAPDFEVPSDAGGNNVYDVTIQVSDGTGGTDTQAIAVTVTDANEVPVITSNGAGATASVGVAENQESVTTVTSSDSDGGTPAYSIVGGADAARFAIDSATGVLTFVAAANFEAPGDAGGNNVYDVTVQVSDGNGGTDTQAIAVTVSDVNDAPFITSNGADATASVSASENQTAVTTVASSDVDGGTPSYSIAGGADAARFAIDSTTGVLTFVVAPNFESPTDAGGNNVYDVIVQVSDGSGGTDTQAIAVTVTNVNEAPVITSNGGTATAAVSVVENQSAVTTVTSSDVDGGAPSYSIVGGADAARFEIDSATGALTFAVAPNFEASTDVGGDNVYDVTVQVSDGNGGTDTQAIAVTVTNVNEAPAITSNGGAATASVSAAENQAAVTTVTSSDVDGGTAVYSIVGGADAARFAIDGVTGVLAFVVAPDFEAPGDADGNNVYDVTVQVFDGNGGTNAQAIAVTVTNLNEAPAISSDGGAATASVSAAENQTAVTSVTSSDVDGGTPSYAIVGGVDAARFAIDSTTGTLSFAVAPNFEAPADAGADNIYDVTVQVSDGNGGTDTQAIAVTVTDVNEAPVITSNGAAATASVNAAENQAAVTTVASSDDDGSAPSYTIVGGVDAARFAIDSTSGALTFVATPNFEAPADAGADNVYDVTVQVSDGNGGVDTQAIAVTVMNVNEAPTITSDGAGAATAIGTAENQTAVTTVTSNDVDGGMPSYSISGGADAARFTIDSASGVLSFVVAPDFEAPVDIGADNVYDVTVEVSDGNGGIDTQAIAVTVTNVNEAPTITSNGGAATAPVNAAENQTAVTTVTSSDVDGGTPSYSIVGGVDAARFAIDSTTGALSFVAAPNFEAATDSGGDNVYDVMVQVSDGSGGVDVQALAVTVTNVNEAPAITSNGGAASASASAAENQTAVTTVTSNDVDGGAATYSISGGADAARFTIDSASGVLSFVVAPNFESSTDADSDNVYDVWVQVSDGNGGTDTQAIAVTVNDVNDAPVINSAGGISMAENQSAVTTVVSTDVDGAAPIYAIVGGADAAVFTLDAVSGELRFIGSKDFEAPADADRDNIYEVSVQVADGNGGFDVRALTVRVTDVNEAPAITSLGGGASASVAVDENQSVVALVAATDPEGDAPRYRIAGGADAARFAIDADTGTLGFVAVPDFEAPADADADNVYQLMVAVDDGQGGTDLQAIEVAVTGINEAPRLDAPPAVSLVENAAAGTVVATVSVSDLDAGDLLSFTLVDDGGGRFVLDAASGRVLVAPGAVLDFEAAAGHTLLLRVTDAQGVSTQQAIVVTLGDVDEPGGGALPPDDHPVPLPTPIELPPVLPVPPVDSQPPSDGRELPGGHDFAPRPEDTSGRAPAAVVDIANGAGDERDMDAPAAPRRAVREDAPRVATVSFLPQGSDWSAASLDALLLPGSEAGAPRPSPLGWLRGSLLDTGPADSERPTEDDAASPQQFVAAVQDPVRVASATLTAGFVWWLTRSGGLLTSILMGIPAWRHVDLLPVLTPHREDDDDDESGDAADDSRIDAVDSVVAPAQDSAIDQFFSNTSRRHGEYT